MRQRALLSALTGVTMLCLSSTGYAAVVNGFEDETIIGNTSTLLFDTLPNPDRVGTGMGIVFNYGSGLVLTVTNPNFTPGRSVIQDRPNHGGLGINGAPNGDNLATSMALSEVLKFTFNKPVTLDAVSANGDHRDKASGGLLINGNQFDFHGKKGFVDVTSVGFMGTMFTITASSVTFKKGKKYKTRKFSGYIEGLQVTAKVPEPFTAGLLGSGLLGVWFGAHRRRRKNPRKIAS